MEAYQSHQHQSPSLEVNNRNTAFIWVLLNREPTSTQLHPPPPSSFQHPPSSTHLQPAHFNLRPALCNTLNNISTKMLHVIGQFPQIYAKKIKVVYFDWKLERGILEVLIPNPDFWNSDPKIHFWANLGPQIQSCPFCLKIGTYGISRILILIPTLVFWISNFKFLFGQIWAKKDKFVHFAWKLAHLVSWGCGFLFQD